MKTIILTGPTASGKTQIALEWATTHPQIEIINTDSMLVYRGADIGTAKPTPNELKKVPHHVINILDPGEPFTAGEFVRKTHQARDEIIARGHFPLLVGGSGFYLKSLLFGVWKASGSDLKLRQELEKETNPVLFSTLKEIDPPSAQRIGLNDRYRLIRAIEVWKLSGKTPSELLSEINPHPDPQFQLWVIDRDDETLLEKIQLRTERMIQDGIIDEVKKIQKEFPASRCLSAVGYREVGRYLADTPPAGRKPSPGIQGLKEEICLATRQLVKSQRTWFKSFLKTVPTSQRFVLEGDRPLLEQSFANHWNQWRTESLKNR